MILNDVKEALEQLWPNEPVDYGMASTVKETDIWNYVVFSRADISVNNRVGFTDRINVAIVREEYVPQEDIDSAIASLEKIGGVRLDSVEKIEFAYLRKPGSNAVVEMVSIPFQRARKR